MEVIYFSFTSETQIDAFHCSDLDIIEEHLSLILQAFPSCVQPCIQSGKAQACHFTYFRNTDQKKKYYLSII